MRKCISPVILGSSQMAPYSPFSASTFEQIWLKVVRCIGNRVPFGTQASACIFMPPTQPTSQTASQLTSQHGSYQWVFSIPLMFKSNHIAWLLRMARASWPLKSITHHLQNSIAYISLLSPSSKLLPVGDRSPSPLFLQVLRNQRPVHQSLRHK